MANQELDLKHIMTTWLIERFDLQTRDVIFWAPSRQIMTNLSTDASTFAYISGGISVDVITQSDLLHNNLTSDDPVESYVEYNKSRELQFIRNGPINGAVANVSSVRTVAGDSANMLSDVVQL